MEKKFHFCADLITKIAMTKEKYLEVLNSPFKMWLFLFTKIPSNWFMGVRVGHCDYKTASATLPYGLRSQNPFKSIFFAAQCAAGELSTGMLCMLHTQGDTPISMLVTHQEAEFYKKAAEKLTFTCTQGEEVEKIVKKVIETNESQVLKMESIGTLPDGTVASKVWITWSFKAKKRR
jgi:Domain of unknown function (DUF4442)